MSRSIRGRSLLSGLGLIVTSGGLLFAPAQAQDPNVLPDLTTLTQPEEILVVPTGLMEDTGEENYANKVVACFATDTPLDYVAEVEDRVLAINLAAITDRYQTTTRWTGSQGNPVTLTWSFAPDGLSIPSGIGEGVANNVLFSSMDSKFAGQGGRAAWINRFQQVFDRWSAIAGITYVRVTVGGNDWDDGASWGSSGAAGLRGDIRICAKPMDGANGVLAYNFFPGTGNGGNMHLDSAESWGSSTNLHRFLRNTIAHEHGHGIGLLHVCPIEETKLMEPFLATNFDGPQHDDFRGGQRHYGDPRESDNSAATAASLGTLTFGATVTPCTTPANISGGIPTQTSICSIDADGEQDYFSFAVTGSATCNVTVTPLGLTYENCAQDSQCSLASCATSVNSLTMTNLAVQVISTNGTTVIAEASAAAAGAAETITGASLPSAGTYFIRVYETNAPAQSQLYSLSIVANSSGCVAPSITGHPANQTICSGLSASFSVTATGTSPTYQWRRGTTNLANGGSISGATSPTLTINPVAAGDAAADYNCVVTNACGSATSNNGALTVNTAAAISGQPSSQSACVGDAVLFSVTATGSPAPTFQWRRGTTNLVNGGNIAGATTATLTIDPVALGDAATNYNCVVTNACGAGTSNNATLTVNTAPGIVTHPGLQVVCSGGSASLTVAASGSPTLTYQWRRGTTNLVNGGNISGATSPTLTINPAAVGDAATNYNCVVSNACGSATSNNGAVTVNTAASLTGQPANQTACSGGSASFSVTASGSPTPTFQWRRGTTNLANGGNISGATSATLTINPVAPGDAATNYNCVVSNLCGGQTSINASLTVNVGPSISTHPADQTACVGSVVAFSIVPAGTPPFTFQWRRGTTNLVNGGPISGANSTTLVITPISVGDAATDYNCLVTNSCGSVASNNAALTVNTFPGFNMQPTNQSVCAGASASLSVGATGSPAPTFQWRRGTTNLVNGGSISGATSATLTINPVTPADADNNYNCVITNTCGSATSSSAAILVDAGPTIFTHPADQGGCTGDSISLSVNAGGSPTGYQWRRGTTNLTDGGNISGATTATLTINPVGAGDAATDYNVVVTNSCGSTTSNNAAITLGAGPTINTHPGDQGACTGGSVSLSVAASGATSHQWRRGTTNLTDGGNISGATTATLTINPVGAGDAATDYNCVVTNGCGSATSNNAAVTIDAGPMINTHPSGVNGGSGCTITLTVVASGSGTLSYQWTRNTIALTDGGAVSGSNSDTLTLGPLTLANAGNYACIVTNACGSATSNTAIVRVCIGDLDGDLDVDLSDLSRLLANFGVLSGATCVQGDLNGDGDVDLADLSMMLSAFGEACP